MSEKVIGYLEETETKSGKTKKGRPWTLYKGNVGGKWVNFGFDRPPCQKGDYITVTLEEKDGNQEVVSVVLTEPPAKSAASAAPAGGGAAADQTAPGSSLAGGTQASITYQSSRKDALALVDVLIAQDALPITAAKTAAGKAKRFEEIMALVDKLTVQYFYDVYTLRNLDRVADAGANAPAPAALPEDAQEAAPTAAAEEPDSKPGEEGNW